MMVTNELPNKALTRNKLVYRKANTVIKDLKENGVFFIMLLPSALLTIMLCYIPMFGIIIAFKEYNFRDGMFGSKWSGLKNFEFFFKSGKAWLITRNTLLYNLVFIITGTIIAIMLAIFISEVGGKYYKKIAQSAVFLPNFMSWVIISTIAYNIFNPDYGTLNTLRKFIGLSSIDVYSKSAYWYFILPILNIWKAAGWGSIIYFAAIMGIDQECYEAGEIDGANIFQKTWHITLPMLKPTVTILTLLSIGGILRGNFDMFYQLIGNNGILFNSTDIIDTYVFRSLLNNQDIGMSAAAGLYQSMFGFILIWGVNRIIRKISPEYALF